jgi:hypothetical protein
MGIVSNYWRVDHSSVSNDTAEVHMEYAAAPTIDASPRYSPPPRSEAYKTALVFRLVLAATHWAMFRPDGKAITSKEERTGPTEWQIEESRGLPWTTLNTAIRCALERREQATDPVIRKNKKEPLAGLLKLH